MKKDFISICIITKDEEKNILETLQYLTNQSYGKENFEIIIVDGNSKDNTIKTTTKFLLNHKIQHKVVNEKTHKNKWGGYTYGHSFARNVSIDLVSQKSEYIAQIDADCRADKNWLESLHKKIKNSGKDIAGAGGPRLVETKGNISKFELMLNYYFTSYIMTMGNPAFCIRKGLKYIPSIAGYNSMYKTDIIKNYMFNTKYATFFDDIEINYRLSRDGYKFLYCPEAKIWHRLEESILDFYKHMEKYGSGAAKVTKHFKSIPRLYVYMSVGYLIYTLAVIPLSIWVTLLLMLPYVAVFILAIAVFIENIRKTKNMMSLRVFPLVFGHPFMYGFGFIKELLKK